MSYTHCSMEYDTLTRRSHFVLEKSGLNYTNDAMRSLMCQVYVAMAYIIAIMCTLTLYCFCLLFDYITNVFFLSRYLILPAHN